MASDDQLDLWSCALVRGWASVGSVRRRKVEGMWRPSGRVIALDVIRRDWGSRSAGSARGRWRNGSKRPVLKHGPRSLTSMRVFGCKAHTRNESECRRDLREGRTADRSGGLPKDLSKSIAVGTRKMVNYA
jgi:hypothetical protein